jgi:hypothetical protein
VGPGCWQVPLECRQPGPGEGSQGGSILLRSRERLRLLAELGDVQGRLDDLKRRLRELAQE